MRKASCPVLVVSNASQKALATGPDGRHRLRRIIYCTDFSNNSERARGYAISLAAEYGAELTLLHVVESNHHQTNAKAIVAEDPQELDKLISEHERKDLNVKSVVVKSVVKFGKPYEEIVRHASETQPSLIIMTARGGDAVDRAVFGSTTYRVIQLGPCAVLVVHT
jgi:nucleotide-binding universal stress UspA family protein